MRKEAQGLPLYETNQEMFAIQAAAYMIRTMPEPLVERLSQHLENTPAAISTRRDIMIPRLKTYFDVPDHVLQAHGGALIEKVIAEMMDRWKPENRPRPIDNSPRTGI